MRTSPSISAILGLLALLVPVARADSPSDADWSGIRAAHETWRHRFENNGEGAYLARNPRQQWTSRFDGRGFLVEPSGQPWRWGLELRAYGRGESMTPLAKKAEVSVSEGRLSYRWDGTFEEWFLNDARGIEQGWTLGERPAGADADRLRLDLSLRGGLTPQVAEHGREVAFRDSSGIALTYGGLKAWDATGRDLEVRFIGAGTDGIAIEVDDRGAIYPVTVDPVAQQARLVGSNVAADDVFGSAVAISGDIAVVGAPGDDGPGDISMDSGAVYVFVRTGTVWTQQAYLRAGNADPNDAFGSSVAIAGNLLVVGAPREDSTAFGGPFTNSLENSGAAYVYTFDGTDWVVTQGPLKAPNAGEQDFFGQSVAIGDGFIVVGAPYEDQTTSNPEGTNDDGFNDGAAYVFEHNGTMWVRTFYLKGAATDAADLFGSSVAASGDTIVVGASAEDSGLDGLDASGAEDIGAAYVFARSGTAWTEQAFLKAHNPSPGDFFGESVSVSGDLVVVGAALEDGSATAIDGPDDDGAINAGAAYAFERRGSSWVRRSYLKGSGSGSNTRFGRSVAVSGSTIFVGASGESASAGAVYAFLSTPDSPPTIRITGKRRIQVKASQGTQLLRGRAADIDGDLRLVEAKDARPKGPKRFRPAKGTSKWSYRARLRPGRNLILVRAADATGATSAVARVTVIRK